MSHRGKRLHQPAWISATCDLNISHLSMHCVVPSSGLALTVSQVYMHACACMLVCVFLPICQCNLACAFYSFFVVVYFIVAERWNSWQVKHEKLCSDLLQALKREPSIVLRSQQRC